MEGPTQGRDESQGPATNLSGNKLVTAELKHFQSPARHSFSTPFVGPNPSAARTPVIVMKNRSVVEGGGFWPEISKDFKVQISDLDGYINVAWYSSSLWPPRSQPR